MGLEMLKKKIQAYGPYAVRGKRPRVSCPPNLVVLGNAHDTPTAPAIAVSDTPVPTPAKPWTITTRLYYPAEDQRR